MPAAPSPTIASLFLYVPPPRQSLLHHAEREGRAVQPDAWLATKHEPRADVCVAEICHEKHGGPATRGCRARRRRCTPLALSPIPPRETLYAGLGVAMGPPVAALCRSHLLSSPPLSAATRRTRSCDVSETKSRPRATSWPPSRPRCATSPAQRRRLPEARARRRRRCTVRHVAPWGRRWPPARPWRP